MCGDEVGEPEVEEELSFQVVGERVHADEPRLAEAARRPERVADIRGRLAQRNGHEL
jgi:hypothetical protein